jgi:hypothetical protein
MKLFNKIVYLIYSLSKTAPNWLELDAAIFGLGYLVVEGLISLTAPER